jgi:hypothetical protein
LRYAARLPQPRAAPPETAMKDLITDAITQKLATALEAR